MMRPLEAAIFAGVLVAPLHRAAAADVDQKEPVEAKERGANFAVVPGPFYNPSLGVGLNVMPVMMFHPDAKDAVSPPSLALMTILYAAKPPFEDAGSRQSLFLNAATRLFLDEDRWRVVVMGAYINLYQQFFGLGGDVSSDAGALSRWRERRSFPTFTLSKIGIHPARSCIPETVRPASRAGRTVKWRRRESNPGPKDFQ